MREPIFSKNLVLLINLFFGGDNTFMNKKLYNFFDLFKKRKEIKLI
jgi:hypothetical protein